MEALAHLGDDEVVRRISPYVREWRVRGERKRALQWIHGADW